MDWSRIQLDKNQDQYVGWGAKTAKRWGCSPSMYVIKADLLFNLRMSDMI